jgi:hypothetical protein
VPGGDEGVENQLARPDGDSRIGASPGLPMSDC